MKVGRHKTLARQRVQLMRAMRAHGPLQRAYLRGSFAATLTMAVRAAKERAW